MLTCDSEPLSFTLVLMIWEEVILRSLRRLEMLVLVLLVVCLSVVFHYMGALTDCDNRCHWYRCLDAQVCITTQQWHDWGASDI
jgi:hypothetical protein